MTSEGERRERICKAFDEMRSVCLIKNAQYGAAGWERPEAVPGISATEGLLVRISDKFARIRALNSGTADEVGETFRDTVKDLGCYCALWLAVDQYQGEKGGSDE